MRNSSYSIYPGNVQILSRYTNDKKIIPFQYNNQMTTTVLDHPHYGPPRLEMAWQADFTTFSDKGYPTGTVDPKGPIFPWPFFDTLSDVDYPDPYGPPVYTYSYWFTKQTSVSTNTFRLQTTSQSGPPGDTYAEYVQTIIFNDSFDAPFEKYTVV